MFDLLITNGTVVDGTGNPWFAGHIGISEGRIVSVMRGTPRAEGQTVIDASGLVVAPGFIDLHTHSDYSILKHNHGLSTLHAGVTTEVLGLCGYGVFPVREERRAEIANRTAAISQSPFSTEEVDWTSLDGWLAKLEEGGVGYNVAHLCGHGALRSYVMGEEGSGGERVHPDNEQLEDMKHLLKCAMDQGAFGLATGLSYAPGRNAATEEIVKLADIVADRGGLYASHIRSEGQFLISAAGEFTEIARRANLRATLSHHKAFGIENWGKIHHTLHMLSKARDDGIDVVCDFYPWEYAAQSNLGASFFTDFETAPRDHDSLKAVLESRDRWRQLRGQLVEHEEKEQEARIRRAERLKGYGIEASESADPLSHRYVVCSPAHPELENLSIGEIHRAVGEFESHHDTLRWLYLEDDGVTQVAGGRMGRRDIDTLIRYPHSCISTDGWTFSGPFNRRRPSSISLHPRNYGTHARVLGRYVRERKIISLEEAVRKMTSLPAAVLGITDRGILAPGRWADITLFDPETVRAAGDHRSPDVHPEGIIHVIVNGSPAIRDGEPTKALSGRVLRRR